MKSIALHHDEENECKRTTLNTWAEILSRLHLFIRRAEVEESVCQTRSRPASNPAPLAFSFVQAPQQLEIRRCAFGSEEKS